MYLKIIKSQLVTSCDRLFRFRHSLSRNITIQYSR